MRSRRRDQPNPRAPRRGRAPRLRFPVAALAVLVGLVSVAGAGAIPESAQVPIFFKLLTYDRTLWEDDPASLRLGVLHRHGDTASLANLTAIVEVLNASAGKTVNGVRFDFTTISWHEAAELPDQLADADVDVLYVTDGHGPYLEAVARLTRAAGVLSLAGDAGDVDSWLSVGIDRDDDRPRLVVNLEALAAEGHQLDARVLRLCRVVKR